MFSEPPVNDNEIYDDLVLPFLLEKTGIRGRFVRLSDSVNTILTGHNYPQALSSTLGEMLVVVAMLGSTIKTRGIIHMQAQGDGVVKFIVADYTADGHLRGYAGINDSASDAEKKKLEQGKLSLQDMLGSGHIVITIEDELSGQNYQGIVELGKGTLAESLEQYFAQSVQRQTRVEIAVDRVSNDDSEKPHWQAGGIMLQHTPKEGGNQLKIVDVDDEGAPEDDWQRSGMLLSTVKDGELTNIDLSPNTLLFQLFHEEAVVVYQAEQLQAKCRCLRDRIKRFLDNLDAKELKEIENEEGEIEVVCQFCTEREVFLEADFNNV